MDSNGLKWEAPLIWSDITLIESPTPMDSSGLQWTPMDSRVKLIFKTFKQLQTNNVSIQTISYKQICEIRTNLENIYHWSPLELEIVIVDDDDNNLIKVLLPLEPG